MDWYVYGKMESIVALGGAQPVKCATNRDGEDMNVGDIQIQPGKTLRGKITLSDATPMADGMRVTIGTTRGFDTQTAMIGRDGSFEFTGLATGDYRIFPSVRGYQLFWGALEKTIDRDIDTVAIVLDPAPHR